ncbi:MAG: PEP-CTERM sorting domain-containing protein [Planctomycetota bacterium]
MTRFLVPAMALAASAGAAQAQVILTFGFTDVNGSFSTADMTFSGDSVGLTSGDVTRVAAPAATALYEPGFVGGTADFSLDIDVMLSSATTADGNGSFTITDADGDTITGDIDGEFTTPGFGVVFFNGLLSNVSVNDLGAVDGQFDGPSGGAFASDLPGEAPYDGALVQLFIGDTPGFFDTDFTGISTQVDGIIVPAPASVALIGLGAAGLLGRRRR